MLLLLNVAIPSLPEAKPYLEAHMQFLNTHFERGFFKWFGAYLPAGSGGFAVIEAPDLQTAQEVLSQDPLTARKLCVNELREIKSGRIQGEFFATLAQASKA